MTEGPAALVAFEGFLCDVDAHVRPEVSLLAELFAADVAAVRFLSGVQPDVQLLRQDRLKGLPAEGAGFAPLLVSLKVALQVVG